MAFDFEDVDIAAPMGREVLVKVQASGLCHTDLLFATTILLQRPPCLVTRLRGSWLRLVRMSRNSASEITS